MGFFSGYRHCIVFVLILNCYCSTLGQSTEASAAASQSGEGNGTIGVNPGERKPSDPPAPVCPKRNYNHCIDGFSQSKKRAGAANYCYKYIRKIRTWKRAQADCRKTSRSDLIVWTGGYTDPLSLGTIMGPGYKVWSGLVREDGGSFTWNLNSWPFGEPRVEGGYWAPGQPTVGGGNCGAVTSEGWVVADCESRLGYLCMHYPTANPPVTIKPPTLSIQPPYYDDPKYLLNGSQINVACTYNDDMAGNDTAHRILLVGPPDDNITYISTTTRISKLETSTKACYYERILEITLQVEEVLDKMIILCLTDPFEQEDCPSYQDNCKSGGPFTVVHKVSEHVPRVEDYKRLVFVGDVTKFTCRARVNITQKLVWYVPGVPLKEGKDYATTLDSNGEYGKSVLSLSGLRRDQDGVKVTCYNIESDITEQGPACPNDNLTLCEQTEPIKVYYGPKPPKLVPSFHKKPNVAYLERHLAFTCRANVGDYPGASLVWAIINPKLSDPTEQVNLPQTAPEVYGVVISNKTVEKNFNTGSFISESNLTFLNISQKHEGLVVSCFSFVDFAKIAEMCPKGWNLCTKSAPLSVQEYKEETSTRRNQGEGEPASAKVVVPAVAVILLLSVIYSMEFTKPGLATPNSIPKGNEIRKSQHEPPGQDGRGSPEIGVTVFREEMGPDGQMRRCAETSI